MLLMAGLFWFTARSVPAFPPDWRDFLAGVLAVVSIFSPWAGQLIFTLLMGLALYTISIYLAVLALAILLPLWFFGTPERFTLVLLGLATTWLVPYHLVLLPPLLVAMVWGGFEGAWLGVMSAWWLKIMAGMSNLPPDLFLLEGYTFSGAYIASRFHQANSLETLLWMFAPLAPNAHALLFHLLQSMGWGLTALGAGMSVSLQWPRPLRCLVLPLGSVGGAWLGSWGLPWLLGLRATWQPAWPIVGEVLLNTFVAWLLFTVYQHLSGTRHHIQPFPAPAAPPADAPAQRPIFASPSAPPARFAEENEHDIIKLDLD